MALKALKASSHWGWEWTPPGDNTTGHRSTCGHCLFSAVQQNITGWVIHKENTLISHRPRGRKSVGRAPVSGRGLPAASYWGGGARKRGIERNGARAPLYQQPSPSVTDPVPPTPFVRTCTPPKCPVSHDCDSDNEISTCVLEGTYKAEQTEDKADPHQPYRGPAHTLGPSTTTLHSALAPEALYCVPQTYQAGSYPRAFASLLL